MLLLSPFTLPTYEVKHNVAETTPGHVGRNRTTTDWVELGPRLKEPPETMLNGEFADALPVRIPPPVFWTTNVLSTEPPTATVPKSCEVGVTDRAGGS